jgi:hypothetical protein
MSAHSLVGKPLDADQKENRAEFVGQPTHGLTDLGQGDVGVGDGLAVGYSALLEPRLGDEMEADGIGPERIQVSVLHYSKHPAIQPRSRFPLANIANGALARGLHKVVRRVG